MSPRTFLVTGATGQQGGATLDALLARGHRVRALTRKPDSPSARRLAGRGVEVAAGDLEDTASLDRALAGVDGAFLVTTFMGGGASVESEERQGKNLVEAAARTGLRHLVFSSVGGAERRTGIPHFESKWRIEEHARARGVPFTVVRPAFFMENLQMPFVPRALFTGGLQTVLGQTRTLQMIAAADIGIIAAGFLDEGPSSAGMALEIASEALTVPQLKETYRRVTGKGLIGLPMPRALLRRMPAEISRMLFWFGETGYQADIEAVRRRHPGMLSFEAWLARSTGRAGSAA
jgi:uncharacterized protein YbjT (DUF2867 family)